MASKNDENFVAFCDELRAYVEEHKLFPQKHSRLSHKIKYTRKKINDGTGGSNGSNSSSGSTETSQYALNISSANTAQGTVNDSVNKSYTEGSRVTITATPKSGFAFGKWSDGSTQAIRSLTIDKAYTLVASFKAAESGGTDTGNTGGGGSDSPADFM